MLWLQDYLNFGVGNNRGRSKMGMAFHTAGALAFTMVYLLTPYLHWANRLKELCMHNVIDHTFMVQSRLVSATAVE